MKRLQIIVVAVFVALAAQSEPMTAYPTSDRESQICRNEVESLAPDKYRKLVDCTCSIQISITGITWCKGQRYKCKSSGFEKCTESSQETPCDCDCK